ncbi:MAG: LicD family protein [Lachnospiraceae bacterium]|nr:LicD family protein [Lachnospiraceae bacterium]
MRVMTNEEQKKTSLQILRDIDSLCSAKGFHYYIAYGTLLGAIRHKGFIPWDDDIDIWVPLSEYEDFLAAVRENTSYAVLDHLRDSDWLKCFSKISAPETIMKDQEGKDMALKPYGVAVDVFPLFPAVKNEEWCKKITSYKRNLAMIAKKRMGKYQGLGSLPQKAVIGLFQLFGRNEQYWKKKLLEKEQEVKDSGVVGCVISPYRGKDIHDASAFSKQCDLMFEGLPFKAPAGWDSILKDIYGDYMTPPPPEKRVTNHEEIAYYL